jgi:hypothetical protein
MKKVTGRFDYNRRYSLPSDKLNTMDVAWDMTLAGPDGAWYHFYVPRNLAGDDVGLKAFLNECKYHASWVGDVVKCSFEFQPE